MEPLMTLECVMTRVSLERRHISMRLTYLGKGCQLLWCRLEEKGSYANTRLSSSGESRWHERAWRTLVGLWTGAM